eukprot:comp21332_c0_seq1/m.45846 comp21332_c0_seq1/g.45846  ORF comp21332_c0_seq1/g.45846 comp21332_c0_seq1/m.45846 type:complete len:370 (-) comp21332_c0_seq1:52-1161(-)
MSAGDAKPAEPPKPMSFAVMRNSHEAMRAAIRVMGDARDAEFPGKWAEYQCALAVHAASEDLAMFPLLNTISAGSCDPFAEEHQKDQALATAVDAAIASGNIDTVSAAFEAWKSYHLQHMTHEEKVMMPLTMKTGETPEQRSRVFHDAILSHMMTIPNFPWYIEWCMSFLSRFGSSEQPAAVAARVFAWGLQHACSPSQWGMLLPAVQRGSTPEIWTELVSKWGIDGPGKIPEETPSVTSNPLPARSGSRPGTTVTVAGPNWKPRTSLSGANVVPLSYVPSAAAPVAAPAPVSFYGSAIAPQPMWYPPYAPFPEMPFPGAGMPPFRPYPAPSPKYAVKPGFPQAAPPFALGFPPAFGPAYPARSSRSYY